MEEPCVYWKYYLHIFFKDNSGAFLAMFLQAPSVYCNSFNFSGRVTTYVTRIDEMSELENMRVYQRKKRNGGRERKGKKTNK